MRAGRARLVAVMVAAALAAAACTGDDGDSTGGTGSEEPDPEGILRYGLEMEVNLSDTFDPAASRSECDSIVLDLIYDTLIRVGDGGELQPGLAESWDLDESGMTLRLRPGLTFHDGTTVDAAAVKRGLEHNQTGEQTGPGLADVTSISVVDPLTVRLGFDRPVGTMPITLAGREGMIVAPSALDTGNAGTDPMGAGPFEFDSFAPGQRISLSKFDDHWAAEEYLLGGIRFVQVGVGPPAVTALRGNDLDLVSFEAESLPDIDATAGVESATSPSEQYLQLQFRISRPNPQDRDNPTPTVFGDVRVRQAINHAIDRERINQVVLGGQGEVAWMPFPRSSPAHNPAVAEQYPYDPELARDLLRQAGLADGFTFDMVIPGGGIVSQERQAEFIQSDLAEIGVTANIIRSTEIAPEYYIQKTGDAFSAARLPSDNPVLQVRNQWGEFQFVAIHNGAEHSELTELTRRAEATVDEEARNRILQDAMTIIVEEALEAPLVFQPRNIAWSTRRLGGTPSAPRSACEPAGLQGVFVRQ